MAAKRLIAAAAAREITDGESLLIDTSSTNIYVAEALRLLGHDSTLAPDDCVAAGHWRIARAAGLC